MKNLIILLLVFCTLSTYGQKKITKIGVLELGMHIDSFLAITGVTYEIISTDKQYYSKTLGSDAYFLELIGDTVDIPSTYLFPFSKEKRVLIASSIKISEKITLEELELMFWMDKLYYIQCKNSSDLEEALTLKYGEPKITKKTTPKNFVNGLGQKVIKYDETFSTNWNSANPQIVCENVISKFYSSQGKMYKLDYFSLRDKSIVLKVDKIEQRKRKQVEIKLREVKYSDF